MQIRKFEIDGKEIEFVNESRDTYSGFAHDTHLFINGYMYREATCHYINRTWERYAFQSVMRKAVYELREARENYLKDKFKADNGYKKLTAKRAEEFEAFKAKDEEVDFYTRLLEELK